MPHFPKLADHPEFQSWLRTPRNPKINPLVRWARDRTSPWALRRCDGFLDKIGLSKMLMKISALRPEYSMEPAPCDLGILYRAVRAKRPKVILEFGFGWSTYVLAKALADNNESGHGCLGHLISVDTQMEWLEVTKNTIPPELRPLVTQVFSELTRGVWRGVDVLYHSHLSEIRPDIVFLDGPASPPHTLPAADLAAMEEKLPADVLIIIDKRDANATFLRQNLRRNYKYDRFTGPVGGTFRLHTLQGLGANIMALHSERDSTPIG